MYLLCSSCHQPASTCSCSKVNADNVTYTGPTLPCFGIETNDSLTVIIQKLNYYFCPTTTTSTTSTTSTSTSTSTTTSTTTVPVFSYNFTDSYANPVDACVPQPYVLTLYSPDNFVNIGTVLFDDPGYVTPFNGADLYHRREDSAAVYQINAFGVVTLITFCA